MYLFQLYTCVSFGNIVTLFSNIMYCNKLIGLKKIKVHRKCNICYILESKRPKFFPVLGSCVPKVVLFIERGHLKIKGFNKICLPIKRLKYWSFIL